MVLESGPWSERRGGLYAPHAPNDPRQPVRHCRGPCNQPQLPWQKIRTDRPYRLAPLARTRTNDCASPRPGTCTALRTSQDLTMRLLPGNPLAPAAPPAMATRILAALRPSERTRADSCTRARSDNWACARARARPETRAKARMHALAATYALAARSALSSVIETRPCCKVH